ncbi:MAG: hypothetical protein ABRQ32_09000 [Smithellaceae bacterium]|jgi:hypothetical protein
MNLDNLRKLIDTFFSVTKELKDEGLFRSDRYLGDIGEAVCAKIYNLKLCTNGREQGHDATKDGKKYQIKLHNSETRTNMALGNPDKYDFLLLVVGPNSKIKKHAGAKQFAIYKFTSDHVKRNFKKTSGFSCGKKGLPNIADNMFDYKP